MKEVFIRDLLEKRLNKATNRYRKKNCKDMYTLECYIHELDDPIDEGIIILNSAFIIDSTEADMMANSPEYICSFNGTFIKVFQQYGNQYVWIAEIPE